MSLFLDGDLMSTNIRIAVFVTSLASITSLPMAFADLAGACRVMDGQLSRIVGGQVSCTSVGTVHADGWSCPANGTGLCQTLCNPCSALNGTDQATCQAATCWRCKDLNPQQMIRMCTNTGGNGCSDFNGGAACGVQQQKSCTWSSVDGNCNCNSPPDTNLTCPRRHCSSP